MTKILAVHSNRSVCKGMAAVKFITPVSILHLSTATAADVFNVQHSRIDFSSSSGSFLATEGGFLPLNDSSWGWCRSGSVGTWFLFYFLISPLTSTLFQSDHNLCFIYLCFSAGYQDSRHCWRPGPDAGGDHTVRQGAR